MKKLSLFFVLVFLLLSGCGKQQPSGVAEESKAADIHAQTPYLTPTPEPTTLPTPEPSPEPTPEPTPAITEKPISPEVKALLERNEQIWKEKGERVWMAGRLIIPSVAIDVALFVNGEGDTVTDMRQFVCDAPDSAVLYNDGTGNIIADHSNQSFATLHLLEKYDRAYLAEGDCILTLECKGVIDGYNTGDGIWDLNYASASENNDFTCYTCGEDWEHIKIAGFQIVDADYFELGPLPVSS